MDRKLDKQRSKFKYTGSLVGPIILITIGAIFLLSNLGYLSGDVWDIILRLWPLILVAIGLDNVLRGHGVTGPLLFIGIGVVIILSNFELISWNVWDLLLKLWPIFLIAIGLDLVISRRSIWGAILATLLLVIVLFAALWYFGSGPGVASSETIEIVQRLDDADQASIVLKPSVANVDIDSLSSTENLLEGTIYKWSGESVQKEYDVVGGKGDFSLRSEGFRGYRSSPSLKPGWDIRINDLIPVTVDFELGVGEVNLDLQDLVVNEFKINTSVGKIVLTLPSNGHVVGEIGNPIGSIWINVPPNTALRLKAETGLTNIHVPPEYQLEGDNYISPGYSSVENQVDLIINQAIGLVRVEKIGR